MARGNANEEYDSRIGGSVFYTHWISRFRAPKTITTEQRSQFESTLFGALANFAGAKHIHATTYHPASNGLIERLKQPSYVIVQCPGSNYYQRFYLVAECAPRPQHQNYSTVRLSEYLQIFSPQKTFQPIRKFS
jgi:transposase InsO family protein